MSNLNILGLFVQSCANTVVKIWACQIGVSRVCVPGGGVLGLLCAKAWDRIPLTAMGWVDGFPNPYGVTPMGRGDRLPFCFWDVGEGAVSPRDIRI